MWHKKNAYIKKKNDKDIQCHGFFVKAFMENFDERSDHNFLKAQQVLTDRNHEIQKFSKTKKKL